MQILPCVVRTDQKTGLCITNPDAPFLPGKEYRLVVTHCDDFTMTRHNGQTEEIKGFPVTHSENDATSIVCATTEGRICFTVSLPGEQEHIITVYEASPACKEALGQVMVYSLREDLFSLRPYKGDFHLHSNCSDGADEPYQIAIACRKRGYDFMAITDHGKMDPSLKLREFFRPFNPAIKIWTGEEIHLPDHRAHILNINGAASINCFFSGNSAQFEKEIQDFYPTEDAGCAPYMFASAEWAFNKIREYGGLSVFCHPYWRRRQGCDLATSCSDALLKAGGFDAWEVVSGYKDFERDGNTLQIAKYHELAGQGVRHSVVGTSDAHSTSGPDEQLFGQYYTIVLAKSLGFEDIKRAIQNGAAVAVEQWQPGQLRITGDYRYVRYTLFLAKHFFPQHDTLAAEEGTLMETFAAKETMSGSSKEQQTMLQRLQALYQSTWAKKV